MQVGKGPAYLMGAEGAPEIEAALTQLGVGKGAATVSWRMPNGGGAGIRFSSAQLETPAIADPAPAGVAVIADAVPIDYCTVDFQPAPEPPAVARTNLRRSKVLVICDQPQVPNSLNVPGWIYVAPGGLRIPGAHPIDLSSESEFLKSCETLALKDLDAVIAVAQVGGRPIEIAGGHGSSLYGFRSSGRAQHGCSICKSRSARQNSLRSAAKHGGQAPCIPLPVSIGGMIKSLARELPKSQCKAVHTNEPVGEAALQQLHAELDGGADSACEVAYRDGVRHVLKLVRAQASPNSPDALGLKKESVILATGGGRGITAKMVEAILRAVSLQRSYSGTRRSERFAERVSWHRRAGSRRVGEVILSNRIARQPRYRHQDAQAAL